MRPVAQSTIYNHSNKMHLKNVPPPSFINMGADKSNIVKKFLLLLVTLNTEERMNLSKVKTTSGV